MTSEVPTVLVWFVGIGLGVLVWAFAALVIHDLCKARRR